VYSRTSFSSSLLDPTYTIATITIAHSEYNHTHNGQFILRIITNDVPGGKYNDRIKAQVHKEAKPVSTPFDNIYKYHTITPHRLFNDPTFSDLTIKVGTTTFKVHKAILALHTSFLTDAIKESGCQESKDNTVTIKYSAHAVWRLLMYCYTGDYDVNNNANITDECKYHIQNFGYAAE
jgi:hypothetical protein